MTASQQAPVFVHSSFRTSSTWFWSELRKYPGLMTYCEIFNELYLPTGTRSGLMLLDSSSWPSGHPPGSAYFLEFAPLIKDEGGVEGLTATMSFDRFIPPDGIDGAIGDDEASYIAGLIANARQHGKIPVVTSTRSLGRIAGIKARFEGLHIFLYRNLFQQWCSYTEQAFLGNPYFLSTVNITLENNGHDPVLRQIAEIFPCNAVDASGPNLFYRFVFLHLYLYGRASMVADVVVDINRLTEDDRYRNAIEGRLTEHVGFPVELRGPKTAIGFSLLEAGALTDLPAKLRLVSALFEGALSPQARALVEQAIAGLLTEQSRSEFYTGRLLKCTKGLITQRDKLTADALLLSAELAGVRAERDRFATDSSNLRRELEDARAICKAQEDRIDTLMGLLEKRQTAYARVQKQRAALALERDNLRSAGTWRLAKPARTLVAWAMRSFLRTRWRC